MKRYLFLGNTSEERWEPGVQCGEGPLAPCAKPKVASGS
jgi:hypothetical protein